MQAPQRLLTSYIWSSSVATTVGVLIGHPFETIKVRMQMAKSRITARQCLKNLVKYEGPLSLWKGLAQPLMYTVPVTSVLFITSEFSKPQLRKQWPEMTPFRQSLIAGALSGFTCLFVLVPGDLLKSRAQSQQKQQVTYKQMVR